MPRPCASGSAGVTEHRPRRRSSQTGPREALTQALSVTLVNRPLLLHPRAISAPVRGPRTRRGDTVRRPSRPGGADPLLPQPARRCRTDAGRSGSGGSDGQHVTAQKNRSCSPAWVSRESRDSASPTPMQPERSDSDAIVVNGGSSGRRGSVLVIVSATTGVGRSPAPANSAGTRRPDSPLAALWRQASRISCIRSGSAPWAACMPQSVSMTATRPPGSDDAHELGDGLLGRSWREG